MLYNHCVAYSFGKTTNGDKDAMNSTVSPGPGKYYPSNYTLKHAPGFKMGTEERGTDRKLKTPGVGQYGIPVTIPEGPKYSMKGTNPGRDMTKQHISPGPAQYKPYYSNSAPKYSLAPRPKTTPSKVPGVGQYDVSSDKNLKAPSYIFGSEPKGNATNINNPNNSLPKWNEEDPGPGNYNPNTNVLKQSHPKFTFDKEPRGNESVPNNPGVGSYSQKPIFGTESAHALMVPSSSSPRIPLENSKPTPGPGQYNSTQYNKTNCPKFKMGTSQRDCSTLIMNKLNKTCQSNEGSNLFNSKITPGPGDYNPDQALNKTLQHAPKWGMGFNDPNAEDPNMRNHPISPGPGKYNTSENMGRGAKYSMVPRNEPKNKWLKSTPGPGQYNNGTDANLNKNPTWKIGTEPLADEMKNVKRDDYPGPGQYYTKAIVLGPGYTFHKEVKLNSSKTLKSGPGTYKIPCSIVDVNSYTRDSGKFDRQFKYV